MKIEDILREHNKKITPERIRMFQKMQEFHIFSARDIKKNFSDIPRASIFRTLKLFHEIGILRKIHLEAGVEQYEINLHTHNHEHMKCKNCGKIISFESSFLYKLLKQISKNHKFHIKEYSINVFGKCNNCQ